MSRFYILILMLLPSLSPAQTDSITVDSSKVYLLGIKELYPKLQSFSFNYFADIEVISATKLKQRQSDAPNIINAFSRNHVLDYGFISSNDLLYSQAGFFPTQDYDRRTVGFRGMFEGWNNNSLLMLIDGIPTNGSIYGTAFTSEITPLFFAKSIEVIRGAGGALYGSNAMNGVISINTPKVSDLGDNTGEVRFRYGSQNTQIMDVLLGTENDYFGMIGAFNYFATDGLDHLSFDDSERTDNQDFPKQFQVQDKRKNFGFFNKIYGKRKLTGLSVQFHAQEWEFGTGHGWLFMIPDQPEDMQQSRQMFAMRYAPPRPNKAFTYEISYRYLRQGVNWHMRYYPDGTFDNLYPNGATEYTHTNVSDNFLRLQAGYKTTGGNFLMGLEGHRISYNGDDAHLSNIDLENTFEPFADNEFREIRPWFEPIVGAPVRNISGFLQYVSPKFRDKLQLTMSGRYDFQFSRYKDITLQNRPEKNKTFQLFTPRIALVYQASEKLTVKAIAGRAFRHPTLNEMFGSNSLASSSSVDKIKPELVTNYDLGFEYRGIKNVSLKTNFYVVNFENKIGYSVANANLITNLYTLLTAGFESEINFAFKNWEGFANYTFAKRLDEQIADYTISENKSEVTHVPAHFVNLGSKLNYKNFFGIFLAHFHGKQKRKQSDFFENSHLFRPDALSAWTNLDLQFGYQLNRWMEWRIICQNILNQKQMLLKSYASRFDYQRANRTLQTEFRFKF